MSTPTRCYDGCMRKIVGSLIVSTLVLLGGCKKDKKDGAVDPAPVGSAATPGDATAAVPDAAESKFPLNTGESYYGGKPGSTNLVEWKLPDGSIVQLGIVTIGKNAEGRDESVLRAYHAGGDTYDVGSKFSLEAGGEQWAELKALPNNRMLFRFGDASKSRQARNAMLLRWDADAKRVKIAKRWAGKSADQEPEWLLTGEFKPAPESADLCVKVIARIVSCAKDPKFRAALMTRSDAAQQDAMLKHFDEHVATWKKPDAAKAQCQKWASDEIVETHFTEPQKLKNLAGETKATCEFFGAEIVDEGGLPIALTDPNPPK